MLINLQVLTDDESVVKHYEKYIYNQSTDSGLDIIMPDNVVVPPKSFSNKIKLGIKCEINTSNFTTFRNSVHGYMLLPRSSTGSKTKLRLSNQVGVIDFEYRGEIMALVDNFSDDEFVLQKGERYFQLVAPDFKPINIIELINKDGNLTTTERGEGGFGSTNK